MAKETSSKILLYLMKNNSMWLLRIYFLRIFHEPFLFKIILEVLTRSIRPKKKKSHSVWKGERSKTIFIHRWHDLLYRISWGINKKLLELINEYRKARGYKINTQKATVFLYTSNKQSKNKINNSIYNKIKNKTHRMNLIKEVQDVCYENYKMLLKAKEKNKWIGRQHF